LAVLRSALRERDVELAGSGLDAVHGPRRVVDIPRYRAMERFFDADGPAGRTMMCSSASVQVNLDFGEATAIPTSWRAAHALGPVLVAAFANSPVTAGVPNGYRSGRAAIWLALDPTRAAPVGGTDPLVS